jgi:hypothetical protein
MAGMANTPAVPARKERRETAFMAMISDRALSVGNFAIFESGLLDIQRFFRQAAGKPIWRCRKRRLGYPFAVTARA